MKLDWSWSEVRPKGVRDKAYMVLKRDNNPKHFSEIAKLINVAGFQGKKANVQTVHNELIKDDRFVLVGRECMLYPNGAINRDS